MKKPLVSVLIPVYNVEEYLERCLDSVISQSLIDIEIICVNDGSTDNSYKILEKYAKKDSRIRIVTKENGGLPSARNAGLDQANGKYVGFVDSDDFVEKDMFNKMYQIAEQDAADIVICGANIWPESSRTDQWLNACLSPSYTKYTKFEPDTIFSRIDTTPFLWRTLIKKELIDKNSFRLDEDIIIGEDKAFQCKVFPNAERITVIPDKLYNYYWCRPNSLMQQEVYSKLEKKVLAHAKLVERIGCDLLAKKEMKDKEIVYKAFFDWSIPFIYDDFIYLSLEYKNRVANLLIPMWKRLNIYRQLNLLDEWKILAFKYILSFINKNTDMLELSIIIPIEYNSRYVEELIMNIEKINSSSVEIIIVNNGMSNDNYLKVQGYLYKNDNVRLYNSPEHLCYADSLNIAMQLSQGKYISFCDTQDWYKSVDVLYLWLKEGMNNKYDIIVSDYFHAKLPVNSNMNHIISNKNNLFEFDFHNFLYSKRFLEETKLLFTDSAILTGYSFMCKAILKANSIGYFNQSVYVLREMHRADWLSTQKCEKVLESLNELVDLSIAYKNIFLHGAIYSMLNGDWLKQIIINNTRPYCMPTYQCPNGENSQIGTLKPLFDIIGKSDIKMLLEYGYDDESSIFDILYELINQRHIFLSDLSNDYFS